MAGKTLTTYKSDILTDLSGVSDAEWSQVELDRAITKAMADLSRFLPNQLVWETTLDYDEVTDEAVTLTAHGTYKDLANNPVEFDSERICVDAAETTTYTRDTDYTIDYTNGKITSISTGSIGATDTIYCNYKVSRITVDISGITDLIRVDRVEYPVGNIPQSFISLNIWGDHLTIEGVGDDSQAPMSDKKHLVVYYHGEHTKPTASAAGSWPAFLDETIVLAASAYALFHKAVEAEHQAVDNMNHVVTALLKMTTYLSDNTDDDAAAILANITDDAANLRNTVTTGLNSANNYLTEVDTIDLVGAAAVWADELKSIRTDATYPDMQEFIEAGDDYINTVNIGKDVPERYALYAQLAQAMAQQWRQKRQDWIAMATARTSAAIGFVQEATTRLANLRTHIEEAAGWGDIARGFSNQASGFLTTVQSYLLLAEQYRTEAIERRSEAWAIWMDPKQYIGDFTYTALRQPGKYD